MELDELKERTKEKLFKYFPKAKVLEITDEQMRFNLGSSGDSDGGVYFAKMMHEIALSPPCDWDGIIDLRFRTMARFEKDKIVRKDLKLTPRTWARETFDRHLENFIVLKEDGDDVTVLAVESPEAFIGAPRSEILGKFGFTPEDVENAKEIYERENIPELFRNR